MVEYQVDAVAGVRGGGGMLRAGLRRGACAAQRGVRVVRRRLHDARPGPGPPFSTTTRSTSQISIATTIHLL